MKGVFTTHSKTKREMDHPFLVLSSQQGDYKQIISLYGFRMGCDRPSATGWLKNTRRLISHHDFKIGCDPPSATGWLKIQGGSSPTVISELVVTPLLQQGGSKNTR